MATNEELLKVCRTFEVNATQRCNAVCEHCDRLVGLIKLHDTDVTEAQMEKAVDVMQKVGYNPARVAVAGGEPAVNPELTGIIKQLGRLNRNIAVLTNGVSNYELPKHPNRRRRIWFREAHLKDKKHVPFLVSPTDAGMRTHRTCSIQQKCGICFTAFGFTMCPVADSLGHVLRINPYKETPTAERIMDICKHCPHSVRKGPRLELYDMVRTGKIQCPSPTLAAGLEQYQADPITFPRWGEEPTERRKPRPILVPLKMPTGYKAKGHKYPPATSERNEDQATEVGCIQSDDHNEPGGVEHDTRRDADQEPPRQIRPGVTDDPNA
jgi:hypothetical protein